MEVEIWLIPLLSGLLGLTIGYAVAYALVSRRVEAAQAELSVSEALKHEQSERLAEARTELQDCRSELSGLRDRQARLESQYAAEKESLQARLEEMKELRTEMETAFKALSSDTLKSTTQSFFQLAKENFERYQEASQAELDKRRVAIAHLVEPLRESLRSVDEKIGVLEKARESAYAALRETLKGVADTQNALQSETGKLVQALRKPSVRGRWGEVQLERTVEFAGMVDYVDFQQQETVEDDEKRRLRPDMVVRLPNQKRIVVDAKAPLDAYLDAIEAPTEALHQEALNRYARGIREHIRLLSSKRYFRQFEQTPEFVVLFLPGEVFFSAALHQDPQLIEFGTGENVIIATPTTLIALLKAVAYGWKQEAMAEEAARISQLGKELYERIATVADHLNRLGRALGNATDSYNSAIRSIDSRLMVTARKFESLTSTQERELPGLDSLDIAPIQSQSSELSDSGGVSEKADQ